ncbi:hypothetical protein BW723_10460 [Polaribacter reichenbachii]|uniref:Outer membrane protein beta-barrel domain-containing protein n=1 Tax=Polaribacter reichenbachii TaxID=996801 RepID=A0A1B8TNI7_9FLAO|nr:hypothetical protein [Polaribacter reichenbachii]APZ46682.1 hypothetical protein BW723_10460 [Polaribacter reichenbachii]AUC17325.1 hypothetical protein BTO17_00905 [Polaribacter reichenbachii]OBY61226.1 hypothetical protein LPB301_17295 [Polaribacter reichenbachii]
MKTKITSKKMMNKLTLIAFVLISFLSLEQNAQDIPNREKFIFEFGIGGGVISLENSEGTQTFDKSQGTSIFPDLKVGYMVKENLAITASLPGNIYSFEGNDRHFGGILPGVQYWVSNKWWVNGSVGLAIDSPALYDVNDANDNWDFGKMVSFGVGYEFYQKENFAINIQSKVLMGRVNLDNNQHRDAASFGVSVGFNWF